MRPAKGFLSVRRTCPWVVVGLVLAWPLSSRSQPTDGPRNDPAPRLDQVEHLTVADGLSHSTVWDVVQDRQGFLWIGTINALQRYDGYELATFKHDPDDPDSIGNNDVVKILEDASGDLWLAFNPGGVDRYDRAQNRFVHYRHDPEDPNSLLSGSHLTLADGRGGALWIGGDEGLNRLDRRTGDVQRFAHDPARPESLGPGAVLAVLEDLGGIVWVGRSEGLDRFDPVEQTFDHFQHEPEDKETLSGSAVQVLYRDRHGTLWLGSDGGLDHYAPETGRFVRHLGLSAQHGRAITVLDIVEDPSGGLWLATLHDGVFFRRAGANAAGSGAAGSDAAGADAAGSDAAGANEEGAGASRSRSAWRQYAPRFDDAKSLSAFEIRRLAVDRSGILWLAARGSGLDKVDLRREGFEVFRHRPNDTNSLSGQVAWGIAEDRDGTLWVGTNDHGLSAIDRATGVATHYLPSPERSNSLVHVASTAVMEDRAGELWVGTEGGLSRLDAARQRFTTYRHDPANAQSLASDYVFCLMQDRSGDLWIGTGGGGAQRLQLVPEERFTSYQHDPNDPQSLSGDWIYGIYEDRGGEIWVATNSGLDRWDAESDRFEPWRDQLTEAAPPELEAVSAVLQDASGSYWLGTMGDGVHRWDRQAGTVRTYRAARGLPDDNVVSLLEDRQGYLWMATSRGLSRFDPRNETFRNYGPSDGIHGLTFYIGSAFASPTGELFFGGPGGLTAFYPERLLDDPVAPQVALTDFLLAGRSIAGSQRAADSPLIQAPSEMRSLRLDHRHNIFAFKFAALHYGDPSRNRFRYRLEGFEDEWIETDAQHRIAQYTNLDAGRYTFEVRAASKDGVWSREGRSIDITVLPPPWKSWWAYTLYGLTLLTAVLGYVRLQRRELARERLAAEQERRVAERERTANQQLREASRLKDEFLANTSHELRTPLYGMTGLAESLLDESGGEVSAEARDSLSMIVASGRRLSRLVNDILDFSKLRHKSLVLDLRSVDLRALCDVVLALSRPLVGSKSVHLVNAVPAELPAVWADENRLQQILHNLIGNAVKFTEEGVVEVSACRHPQLQGRMRVTVRDTGIGIPEDQHAKIFDAFAQADAGIDREFGGTGLGLAVTRQLVELHNGSIEVESKSGQGAVFSFDLARSEEKPVASLIASISALEAPVEEAEGAGVARRRRPASETASAILVVDDEPVNRRVLLNQLAAAGYRVEEAANGAEALQKVGKRKPDLMLLDVMMPRLSGYEVCRTLRESYSLEELPIIFLTAKNQASDLVVGLAAGANDYLPKPIAKDELLARVETHLALLAVNGELSQLVEERTNQVVERERLLVERDQLIGTLEARNAELARFNYTLAHDLKNPLITIKNYLGLAKRDAEQGKIERLGEDFVRLETAADTLQDLLDDLYELSQVGLPVRLPEELALRSLAEEAVTRLSAPIAERGAEVEILDGLPTVVGDRQRLLEVFLQLLDNALKHLGDESAPRIEIGQRLDGESTVIYVSDNGLGIEARYQERIFGLFERLDPHTAGTGVGLAVARRIVEVHGGRIWVESKGRGHGSAFCFTLPRRSG